MDNSLELSIHRYFDILKCEGYAKSKELISLLVVSFLRKLYNKGYVTQDNVYKINAILDCIRRSSCIFSNSVLCININPSGENNDCFTYTFDFRLK